MQFLAFIMVAIVIEGIVEIFLMLFQTGKFSWPVFVAMLVGIGVCVGTGIDLFTLLGIPLAWPFIGPALTGILVSRGSNYIHDLTAKLTAKSSSIT